MRQLLRRRNAPGIALGVIAVAIAASSGAYAASSTGGTITVCVSHTTGMLYTASNCRKHDKKLSWNSGGPRGIPGANGTSGANGTNGTNGTNGANGINGAVAAYSASGAPNIDFSSATFGSPQTILTLSLPAGSFIVSAQTVVTEQSGGTAGSAFAICHLADGSATWSADVQAPLSASQPAETTVPVSIAVTAAAPSTASLLCWQTGALAGATYSASLYRIDAIQTNVNN